MTQYSHSDLPVTGGRVYHLDLSPEQLAPDIILVGDPDRVPLLAEAYLKDIKADVYHRGLRTVTGSARDTSRPLSIVTSGMGTSSLEIVLQELTILNEIDLETRTRKKTFKPLRIVRLGTSGALQTETELGTAIISQIAIGLDNTGLFYESPAIDPELKLLEDKVRLAIAAGATTTSRFAGRIYPYTSRSDKGLTSALIKAAKEHGLKHKAGITVSSAGFFANQGRDIARVKPVIPDIDEALSKLNPGIESLLIENMEMETSFLFHFLGSLNYPAASICVTAANRRLNTFNKNQQQNILDACQTIIKAFALSC